MTLPRVDEKRAAKHFAWADGDFASNAAIAARQAALLSGLRSSSKNDPAIAIENHLERRSGEYRERFAYRLMARREWDWAALDASQRLRHLSSVIESVTTFNRNRMEPTFWLWGEALLELLGTGRRSLAEDMAPRFLRVVTDGYYTRKVETRGPFLWPQKLGVFALEMLAACRDEQIDWDGYKIPTDPFWLECARKRLREKQPEKAARWMTKLCDAHWEANNRHERWNLRGSEITDRTHFLWPITLHAFIKLRRQLGLEVPEIDYPLARTSFARLAAEDFDRNVLEPEPWFTEMFVIAAGLEPELGAVRDLVL